MVDTNVEENFPHRPRVTTILPCNNLDAAEEFFSRLRFTRPAKDKQRAERDADEDSYRILFHANGSDIHLTQAVEGWLISGKNPFGLYLYWDEVDELAERFKDEIIEKGKKAEHKPWGMYEFSLNGPDEVLIRVGRPSNLS